MVGSVISLNLVLNLNNHLQIEELQEFLSTNRGIPEQELADYLKQWWYLDDDRAFRAAIEINPSWISLFPFVASPAKDWGEDLPRRAVADYRQRSVQGKAEIEAWEKWLERWLEKQSYSLRPSWSFPLADLAAAEMGSEKLRPFVAGMGPTESARLICTLSHKGLCRKLFAISPATFAAGLREAWRMHEEDHPDRRWDSPLDIPVGPLGAEALLADDLLLGFSLGIRACEKGIGVKHGEFWKSANLWPSALVDYVQSQPPQESLRQANLWALLRRLPDLRGRAHETENLGVSSEILEFAKRYPDSWALSLPLIVDRLDLLQGTGESVTLLLAPTSRPIADAIETLCRDPDSRTRAERATGIRATARNILSPNNEMVTLVVDTVSRWVDRTHIFPYPLSMSSSTWMASVEVENAIRAAVSAAESEFHDHFRSSAGLDEDIHTARLLDELERNLTKEVFNLRGLANRYSRGPTASVKYRQASKQTEEPKYGLDLALTINAHVQNSLRYEAAQLVQVKKLRRDSAASEFSHYWTIHTQQLRTLVGISASACYWFFEERGRVLAVPAKLLSAVAAARPRLGESFSVSYSEIRSMAVSLPQFFVDLFIGGWSGEICPEVLQIARGEDPLIQPRFIANLGIEWHQSEADQPWG